MGTKTKQKVKTKSKELNNDAETKKNTTDASGGIAEAAGVTNTSQPLQMHDEAGATKSYRKRKKQYYNNIRHQMEFYFGDANLTKDRFLKQLIDKDPFIPLNVFLTFNKMKALTSNVKDIAISLSNSQLLELDETQQKVKRKIPINENRNVDEKTLYVEALPSTADHDWVRQIFERFGKVVYISLPKYSKSRKIKEFGFVEFEKEDSVNKAIKAFQDFNGVLNMQEQNPAELTSVKSYIKEQEAVKELQDETVVAQSESRKRSKTDERGEESESSPKKCKIERQDQSETSNTENDTISHSETEGIEGETMEKNKRKRRKKSKAVEKLKLKTELNTDVAYYELKILPKKEWKRLRNKYLNLQREKVAELKRKAWREQQELKQQKESATAEDTIAKSPAQEQKKNSKASAKHKLQKMNMNFYGAAEEENSTKANTSEKTSQTNPALERLPLFSFEPGLIVEISFLEPCVNVKEFKADMRQYSSVKYVDIKEGAMVAYLRLESSKKAIEFSQQISCAEYQCKMLCDEAEANYWQKIEKDREQKINKHVKIPQKRGREKVKKLISKHIRFGDDDE